MLKTYSMPQIETSCEFTYTIAGVKPTDPTPTETETTETNFISEMAFSRSGYSSTTNQSSS